MEHPSSGIAYVLGERLGRVDMSELRSRVGLSSAALSQRVPDDEVVRDLVVSAGYAVLGRWREQYDEMDYEQAIDMLESVGAEHLADLAERDVGVGLHDRGALLLAEVHVRRRRTLRPASAQRGARKAGRAQREK